MTPLAARALPVLRGREHLEFRCNGCGQCCRSLRVVVTHHDLMRLQRALCRPVETLIDWLDPDEVDMTGEPGTWVELGVGRRLMVLRHAGSGGCALLDADSRCTAYAARPADCRLFPFHLERDAEGNPSELARLELEGCADASSQAHPDATSDETPEDAETLCAADAQRWHELASYQERVAGWNRLVRHRQRFGRRAGNVDEFLKFLNLS